MLEIHRHLKCEPTVCNCLYKSMGEFPIIDYRRIIIWDLFLLTESRLIKHQWLDLDPEFLWDTCNFSVFFYRNEIYTLNNDGPQRFSIVNQLMRYFCDRYIKGVFGGHKEIKSPFLAVCLGLRLGNGHFSVFPLLY